MGPNAMPKQDMDGELLPLSHAQQRIWNMEQLFPGSSVANAPGSVMLGRGADVAALQQAMRSAAAAHDALRLRLVLVDGAPRQHVVPAGPVDIDVARLPGATKEEVERHIDAFATRRFAALDEPLCRFHIIEYPDGEVGWLQNLHHAVADGWAHMLVAQTILGEYRRMVQGKPAGPAATGRSYREYLRGEAEYLASPDCTEDRAYWLDTFASLPEPGQLARPQPPGHSPACGRVVLTLDRTASQELSAFCTSQHTSVFRLALLALYAHACRLAGTDDVCIGTTLLGRDTEALRETVGMMVHTTPLRLRGLLELPVVAALSRLRSVLQAAKAHQRYPFDVLVGDLRQRHAKFDRLFHILLQQRHQLVDLRRLCPGSSGEPLSVDILQHDDGLETTVTVDYQRACYADWEAKALGERLVHTMTEAVRSPHRLVSDLPLLTEPEQRLLASFNDTAVDYPRDQCIHHLFEQQAVAHPERTALLFGDQRMSYGELDRRANQLAHLLRGKSVGPGAIVPIVAERSFEMIIGIFGVLKAGAAYLPIDPETPAARIRFIIEDSGAQLVLTHPVPTEQWSAETIAVVGEHIDEQPAEALPPLSGATDLAYVIYTSGSTGKPKGAMVEHRAIVNLMRSLAARLPMTPSDVGLHKAPFGFDASVLESFPPLVQGATLCLLEPGGQRAPDVIAKTIDSCAVTHLFMAPTMVEALVGHVETLAQPSPLRTLQCILVGGEAVSTSNVGRLGRAMETGGRCRLVNAYGPAEAAVMVTLFDCTHHQGATVPIGKPLDNNRVHVLDERGRLQPLGACGELCIAGIQLARGYLNRPDLTAEKFVSDPFCPGERMYRTGDLARWRPDGNLEYLGRLDHQVKIRGNRVELGEIEAVLSEHASVRQAAVVAHQDEAGSTQLCAYVVAKDEMDVSALREHLDSELPVYMASELRAQLRAHISARLPDYMVPSVFVLLDKLPLSPNGKLDRKALPAPGKDRRTVARRFVAPRHGTEKAVAAVWSQVLSVDHVGADDNFFDLGGESLLAVRVLSRLRQTHGVELTVRELFNHPSVAGLASLLDGRAPGAASSTIEPVLRQGPLPLSFAQERMWFLNRLYPESPLYSIPLRLRLRGALDRSALEQGVSALVWRHEALRTRFFESDGGEPVQSVMAPDEAKVPVSYVDLRELPKEKRDAEAEAHCRAEAARWFDLGQAPLVRLLVLQLGEQDHVVVLNIHHIAMDAISMTVLLGELCALYQAFVQGRQPQLPEPTLQYVDFAVWQRGFLQGERLEKLKTFWQSQLAGAPEALNLPTDRPRPVQPNVAGARTARRLSAELVDRLRALATEHQTTLATVMLAGFQVIIGRYSGQDDFLVASAFAGRTHPQLESSVGFFVNTMPLRCDLAGEPRFSEVILRTRQKILEADANQELPLQHLGGRDSASSQPMARVVFDYVRGQPTELRLGPHLQAVSIDFVDNACAKFDLVLYVAELGSGALELAAEYSTALFDEATISRLLEHMEVLLDGAVRDPEQTIGQLPILTDVERHQLLVQFNDTAADYARDSRVHELFEAQAAAHPERTALLFGDRRMSYGELDRRANQLAHLLQAKGVAPGVIVPIVAERSFEMIVGIFGVLKVGAAYLPIDPETPAARIRFILEDAGAQLVLAHPTQQAQWSPETIALTTKDLDEQPTHPLSPQCASTDLAYVIYTSGSTGKPKGVLVEQAQFANFVDWMASACPVGAGNVTLYKSVQSFDATILEIFPALTKGGAVCVLKAGEHRDPKAVIDAIERHRVSLMFMVPSMLGPLLDLLNDESNLARVASLRELHVGGEAFPPSVAARAVSLLATSHGTRLRNCYGPTEAVVYAATCDLTSWQAGDCVPIGRPLNNLRAYVLGPGNQPQPIGVPGELCIGGAQAARGYLNQPELTAEKFVANPFCPGERMYRTGDLARWLSDGNLECMGRLDHQVKIRGNRVELGEIEAVLSAHPNVHQVAVVAYQDDAGSTRLCAYVVAKGEMDVSALREHLRAELPAYMVPAFFVELDALPLNQSGKLDRKALPAPDRSAVDTARAVMPPCTEMESRLRDIWVAALGIGGFGTQDDFFDLGGDSILALTIVGLARRQGIHFTVGQLVAHPTIAGLASVAVASVAGVTKHEPKTATETTAGRVPLSPIQHTFFQWDLDEPSHWNMAMLLHTPAPPNRLALDAALQAVTRRHDVFACSFQRHTAGWTAEHRPPNGLTTLAWLDLRAVEDTQLQGAINEHAARIHRSLDIAHGPLFGSAFFDCGSRGGRLLLVIHHLVVDGVSWRILFEDLANSYDDIISGREPNLPPEVTSYGEWVAHLTAAAHTEQVEQEAEFWLSEPRAACPNLPVDLKNDRTANTEGLARQVAVSLSAESTTRLLRAAPIALGARVEELLFAAFAETVWQWTGSERALVTMEHHGRDAVDQGIDLSRTVGWFTAAYPLMVEALPTTNRAARLAAIRDQLRRVPRKGASFGMLRHLSPDAALSQRLAALPQPELSFNYLGQFDQALANSPIWDGIAAESPGAIRGSRARRSELLSLDSLVSAGRLTMMWTYCSALHTQETVEHLAATCLAQIEQLLAEAAVQAGTASKGAPGAALPGDWCHDGVAIDSVVPLRTGVNGTPLFLIPNAGGSSFYYRLLAAGMSRPVFGFQAPGLDDSTTPLSDLRDIARCFLQKVRAIQKEGPYFLGGFCGGGVSALEMAQQLRRMDVDVGLVVLLDTVFPKDHPSPRDAVELFASFLSSLGAMRQKDIIGTLCRHAGVDPTFESAYAWLRTRTVAQQLSDGWRAASETQAISSHVRIETFERMLSVYQSFIVAHDNYRPLPYSGRVVQIASVEHLQDPRLRHLGKSLGWAPTLTQLECVVLACQHSQMLTAPPALLAHTIEQAIASAVADMRHATAVPTCGSNNHP